MNRLLPTYDAYKLLTGHRRRFFNLDPDSRHYHLNLLWRHQILDPDSDIVAHWNHIFLSTCLIALFIDPLYFYLPSLGNDDNNPASPPTCLTTSNGHALLVTFLRSIADLFFLLHMTMKFRTAFVAPSSRVFGRGELVMDPREIAKRYLRSNFIIDLAASLPLPQVLGASWYLLAIGRQYSCWRQECDREDSEIGTCLLKFLDCRTKDDPDRQYWLNATNVIANCNARSDTIKFKYGMFEDAFTKNVGTVSFIKKYFYCLWWGLKNLSSYGQTLDTSTYIGETTFCILICIGGLVLFSLLIGNMQTYLQSMTVKLEEWRVKRRDTEEWMRHRHLPPELQERVRRFVQYQWLATRGVNEESILQSLPLDLRREIQRHLCLGLVRRVPFFAQMDDQLLDAICERLVSSLNTQGTYIVREGDPVSEMLFIIRGELESSTTDGGRLGFYNSIKLRPGDFCGEELLTWALVPNSTLNLPSSTRTAKALTEVEAFALRAEDLKFVAAQFKRLHSKRLQHAFRYYSHQWRTWGACIIQAAWRRHTKRRLANELAIREGLLNASLIDRDDDYSHFDLMQSYSDYEDVIRDTGSTDNGNHGQNFGATVLASRFATNTRKGASHKDRPSEPSASDSLKMPKLFKPDDVDLFDD
uniref:Cyclic nucleotide-binding domain-containing protein n=1 Tax=Kalanchoe fedtschenkoi TaxID=63787 RepID=A0A7N0TNG6_KALFE